MGGMWSAYVAQQGPPTQFALLHGQRAGAAANERQLCRCVVGQLALQLHRPLHAVHAVHHALPAVCRVVPAPPGHGAALRLVAAQLVADAAAAAGAVVWLPLAWPPHTVFWPAAREGMHGQQAGSGCWLAKLNLPALASARRVQRQLTATVQYHMWCMLGCVGRPGSRGAAACAAARQHFAGQHFAGQHFAGQHLAAAPACSGQSR